MTEKDRDVTRRYILERCPFCGGEAILIVPDELTGLSPEINCENRESLICTARMTRKEHSEIPLLIRAWNRRTYKRGQ